MAKLDTSPSEMGMRTEQLTGRTQQVFFSVQESDNLTYSEINDDLTNNNDDSDLDGFSADLSSSSGSPCQAQWPQFLPLLHKIIF